MKKFTNLFIIFAAASLLSCGSGEEETFQLIECGEGTVEEDGACVPSGSCPTGQFAAPDGRCVRADYCAEGTHLDPSRGTCVADPAMRCGPETVEEDGECIPEFVTTCGEGTVAADGRCRPYEEFCGPGTSEGDQDKCRPSAEVCGEGTIYDVQLRQCVRESALSCGAGTTAQDGQCLPISAFYEELRQAPDLDKSDPDAPETIELKEDGEPFAFIGTITADAAQGSDGPMASEDIYRFQGQAGQILRIGVYSLGLLDPGFQVLGDENSYKRLSDLGAGIEASRMLVLPVDGEYELKVSSIIQLSDRGEVMGGDDWDYVGYIQVINSPSAQNVSITDAALRGDIRKEQDNLYRIVGAQTDERFPLFLVNLPATAGVEFMIWEKDSGLVTRNQPGDEAILILPAPAEEFYLFVDYEFASNIHVDYNARVSTEGIRTETIGVEADQFLRITQSNQERTGLNISVDLDGTNLGEQVLADRSAGAGNRYFHRYIPTAGTAYITSFTDTGEPLNNFDISIEALDTTIIEGFDGSPMTFVYEEPLQAGERQYFALQSSYEGLAVASLTADNQSGLRLQAYTADGEPIEGGMEQLIFHIADQRALISVEAIDNIRHGFDLSFVETNIIEVEGGPITIPNTSSRPHLFPNTFQITGCQVVTDIEVEVQKDYPLYAQDLQVLLLAPDSTEVALLTYNSGVSGTEERTFIFPTQDTPSESLDVFYGKPGDGEWQLKIAYDWYNGGTIPYWRFTLTC